MLSLVLHVCLTLLLFAFVDAHHLYLLVALQRRGLRGRLPALLGLLRLGDWQCRGLRGRRRAL